LNKRIKNNELIENNEVKNENDEKWELWKIEVIEMKNESDKIKNKIKWNEMKWNENWRMRIIMIELMKKMIKNVMMNEMIRVIKIELMKRMIMMKIKEIMKWRMIENWENEVRKSYLND